MRGWMKLAFSVAIAILMTSRLAAAQTTTGTITGRVVDSQGLSVPGVTINVEGPNLQGILTVVTSENGDYILPQLPPGTYTVSFQLSGFERQQKTIALAPTQTLPLNVVMGPAALTETVTVVGNSADVLTQTAQVATSFKQDLIATLPTNRDINAILLRAPAVHPTGPGGNYSIAGAMSFESLFMVNGVNVNENVRGQANDLYIEDAIQETTVATDGISAEYGRFSGGVINIVTKSGGNLFSGSFRDTLNNDNWRAYVTGNDAHPFTSDCATCGPSSLPNTKIDRLIQQYEGVFGGPIVKDRLGFFFAGRWRNAPVGRQTVAPLNIPYTFEDRSQRYEGKVTYTLRSNHRVEGTFEKITKKEINGTFNTGTSMDLASLYSRQLPQRLFTISYNGILSPQFFVETRVSARKFTFIGTGSQFTDLINGTLLIDRGRGNLRYWSPTFCGVCDNEGRDNDNEYVKATYFKSTRGTGSHQVVFGYDTFNDKVFANNHQSGSDYRILGTTSFPVNGVIYPQWNPTTTILQYNPITVGTQGTNFRTHSIFFNDNWRLNTHVTFNLGVRWDKNHGVDSAGQLIAKDSAISPRLGLVWDPGGDGRWSVSGSVGKYVAALNSSIAGSSSPGGQPATFQWTYQGAAINPDSGAASLVGPAAAIQQVFDWCNRDSQGLCRASAPSVVSVPGVSIKIPDGLSSPNVMAYAAGVSRQITSRAVVRADYSFRDYRDFYSQRIDTTTGQVRDQFGQLSDLAVVENTNDLKRRYSGVTVSVTYRVNGRTDIGGNYTLSRLWGNFDGENSASGPLTTDLFQYPEYRQAAWYAPEGDLGSDQRHRSTLWVNYGVPRVTGLTISLLQDLSSGLPFGAGGGSPAGQSGFSASAVVDARDYVVNPGYATPQGGSNQTYYFTARDAFRTQASRRTDFAANYAYGIGTDSRKVELFVQAQVLNLFNNQDLCGCGSDVFSNGGAVFLSRIGSAVQTPGTAGLVPFNPLTTAPVEGTNWRYGANWGTPLNRFAFTSPREFRMTFGVRF
ncbi:MAG: TonB-dependent receptor [Acidobacteriota bacterium]